MTNFKNNPANLIKQNEVALKAYDERLALLTPFLVEGALLTCTGCGGGLYEYYFTGYSGMWICGKATKETMKFTNSFEENSGISVQHITHINREPVENYIEGVVE